MKSIFLILLIGVALCQFNATNNTEPTKESGFCQIMKGIGMGFGGEDCEHAGSQFCLDASWFSKIWHFCTKVWWDCGLIGKGWKFIWHCLSIFKDYPHRIWSFIEEIGAAATELWAKNYYGAGQSIGELIKDLIRAPDEK